MTNANPSVNPADEDSLVGCFRLVVNKILQSTDGKIPAIVVAFERGPPAFVRVQPLISMIDTDGNQTIRAEIAKVPVLQLGGGGFVLSFPVKEGDLGWILASDRDISLFLQSYKASRPNTFRKKNFADSLFIPDAMRNFTLDPEDKENCVLQNKEGTVKIALWPDRIKMKAPLGLFLDSPLTVTGLTTFVGPVAIQGGMSATGGTGNSVLINGNLRTVGDIAATGDITPHVPP